MSFDQVRLNCMLGPAPQPAMCLGKHHSAAIAPTGTVLLKYHDLDIVSVNLKTRTVKLCLCGRWAIGTLKAMRDYLKGAGLKDIKPSLAKGEFTALYRGRVYRPGHDNIIVIGLDD